MPQTPNDRFNKALERLRVANPAALKKGVSQVDEMTPEQEAAGDRHSGLKVRQTIRSAKRVAVWIAVIAFGLLMTATLTAFCVLIWVHIANAITDPGKVSELLGDAASWVLVALSALFLDRRLRD